MTHMQGRCRVTTASCPLTTLLLGAVSVRAAAWTEAQRLKIEPTARTMPISRFSKPR